MVLGESKAFHLACIEIEILRYPNPLAALNSQRCDYGMSHSKWVSVNATG